jgi:CTP:molybdopterin cytidylyltransferase MocA/NifU-like protein involved in Fe-S cluster formation
VTAEPSRVPRIGAVVLAAGLSARMGANKLLTPLWGKPVVRHAVEAAAASRAAPVVVVTGNNAEDVKAALTGLPVSFIENKEYTKGLSTSLKCGLRALPDDCDGAVILLGDMPLVAPSLIDGLIAAFDPSQGRAIVVPVRGGRRGNPVLWAKCFFPEMLALEGDMGAKGLMALHRGLVFELEAADDGPLIDIDAPDALAAYETISDPLYTKDVLRLAAEAKGAGRLPEPHGTHTEHNPACSDRSTVDLTVENGRIAAMAHDTRACVLAQASASILAALPGRTYDDLVKLKVEVAEMFESRRAPAEPFASYAALSDVARFPSRQKCVLLPIEAALKAFEASQARKPGGQGTKG